MRVLVVEDDPLVRYNAVEALCDEGFEVLEAGTAEDALKHCEDRAADVIFTDIRLGGSLTGWDIAERCRESNPSLPVIYATGYSHVRPRPVPGSLWFQKPYKVEQIVDAIRSLTSN
jgi:CheY-like chemotaxis protein